LILSSGIYLYILFLSYVCIYIPIYIYVCVCLCFPSLHSFISSRHLSPLRILHGFPASGFRINHHPPRTPRGSFLAPSLSVQGGRAPPFGITTTRDSGPLVLCDLIVSCRDYGYGLGTPCPPPVLVLTHGNYDRGVGYKVCLFLWWGLYIYI
jgi:hypothetical protein